MATAGQDGWNRRAVISALDTVVLGSVAFEPALVFED
jgi:hypothetical protein